MSLTTQKPCLTVRLTSQAGYFFIFLKKRKEKKRKEYMRMYVLITKVCGSEPALWSGKSVDQRIKGTPGITGLSVPRVPIDGPD